MKFAAAILACLVLVGCGTGNLYPVENTVRFEQAFPGGRVYVENPDLAEELAILKASDIFEISENPAEPVHLTLHPLDHVPGCGNPLLRTYFTLGLLATRMPANSGFIYTISDGKNSTEHHFSLQAEERVSLWQYFVKPFKDDQRTLGAVLRTEYSKRYLRPGGSKGASKEAARPDRTF